MSPKNHVTPGQAPDSRPVIDNYGRLSRVPDTGELEKIARQHKDNSRRIAQAGCQEGLRLADGLSAWNPRVRRKDWEVLLERVRTGKSQGVCIWHVDRLFRRPMDLETLIELADKGFRIFSSHGVRDLSSPDDRYILRGEVAHAARSSDDTSRRVKREKKRARAKGKLNGGARSLGWPGRVRRAKGETKALVEAGADLPEMPEVAAEQVQREREAIAQACQDHADGVTLTEIYDRWKRDSIYSTTGGVLSPSEIGKILNRASNAGLIEHDEELDPEEAKEEGATHKTILYPMRNHEEVRIISPELFFQLRAKFTARRRGRAPGTVSIGSGILRCGLCFGGLTSAPGKPTKTEKRRNYTCRKDRHGCGGVSASQRGVDQQLRELVLERLSDPRHAAAIKQARDAAADELAQAQAKITQIQIIQKGLTERLGRLEIDLDAFDRANLPLATQLRALAEREKMLNSDAPVAVEVISRDALAEEWESATVPERREMLIRALGRDRIAVKKSHHPKSGAVRFFDPKRVRIVPSDMSVEEFLAED
ncbi:recombinase family protein [Crossiella sp. CA198]|uniref:recombinase family protein n=1 Tax=Crossiella sp. CA198 TaxID=3455607 RepID=UPI003F8D434E